MLACADDVAINLRMQMVWHGAVDRVHVGVGEQLAIISDRSGDVTQIVGEPIQAGWLGVGDGHQFRSDVHVQANDPIVRCTGEFAVISPHPMTPKRMVVTVILTSLLGVARVARCVVRAA